MLVHKYCKSINLDDANMEMLRGKLITFAHWNINKHVGLASIFTLLFKNLHDVDI